MSSVKIQGNASGTGILTIAAPNTNTDRTLTLPDEDGAVLVNGQTANVGFGTSSPVSNLHVEGTDDVVVRVKATGADSLARLTLQNDARTWTIDNDGANSDSLTFYDATAAAERMRLDSSGNLLVGKATASGTGTGTEIRANGFLLAGATSTTTAYFNRNTSDGEIVRFTKDDAAVGSIGTNGGYPYFVDASGGLRMVVGSGNNNIRPCTSDGSNNDNIIDLGTASVRFDDVYATNGTIQTSDFNEKQDIAELDEAEQRVAQACKGLLRKFRWKDAVAEKGDDARIHFGIIAQDLQAAFAAEGLDAGKYAMFISSTWTDDETGEERTRMGVRYPELLAFIIAAL